MDKETLSGVDELDLTQIIPGELLVAGAAGDQDDFTWEVQFSLDNGATYKPYKDSDGNSSFTGPDVKEFRAISAKTRIAVTGMGTATEVVASGGKAEG